MNAETRLLRWSERDREEYERLAAALARVRSVAAQGRGEIVATVPTGPEEPDDVERARALLAHRRLRDAEAGPLADLFGEPGWDILLTLFIALEEGRTMRSAEIAAAIAVRPPVLRRWLTVLEARGLVWVAPTGADGPPASVSLTSNGMALAIRCVSRA
jgi:DNA-binding MarR family transcriptional regulator